MNRLLLLLLGLGLSLPGYAEDLLEIYRQALSRDAVYASARAVWQAGQEKMPQGRALLLPNVNLTGNTTYNEVGTQVRDPSQPGRQSQFNSNGVTISLVQPLFNKQSFDQFLESKSQLAQSDAQLSVATQDLTVRVSQAYFDVLAAQDNLEYITAQKAAIAEQLASAKRNFEVGTATVTDINDAQARYDLAVSQEIAALNDLEVKKQALAVIIGDMPGPLKLLSTNLPLSLPQPNDMGRWVEAAQSNNPQIRAQEAALEIAKREIERNRSGHYPTINLVGSLSQNASGATALPNGAVTIPNDTTTKQIGIQLNMPIYQGGGQESLVREAIANQDKAKQDLENARRSVTYSTRQAFLGVTSGVAQVKALEQALVSSETSLASTKLGREVGVRTEVDVLNSQQQLYSAKRDLAQARYNFILSQLRLKSAAGQLSEEDLAEVNRWLR
ncbi:MAG TPA: TolC family outer membrane protein [Burkholderiales bacterium]|nr:TolC family outer membrane protein [Burkholderiales bacterium]